MSVSSPAQLPNPSNSSNSNSSYSSPSAIAPPPLIDIDRIAQTQTAQSASQQGASPPRLSTPRTNSEFIQFVGQLKWKEPVDVENDIDNDDSYDEDDYDDDDNDVSPIAQAIIAATRSEEISPPHPLQKLLDDLGVCFEKFFWHPDANHLDLLNDQICVIQQHQGKFQGADASVLVNRVLSATGLFAPQEKKLAIPSDAIRNLCTFLLETLAQSGANLFQPNARRAVHLLECVAHNGLSEAFLALAKAAQFQDGFAEIGGTVFSRAMKNDIPFDLAINLAELAYYLDDDEVARNIMLVCTRVLDHWEEQRQDKSMHEELLGNELFQITHPLVSASSLDALLQRTQKLGLKLTQNAFTELVFELSRCCINQPEQAHYVQKLEALMRFSGLKGSEIWIDDMPLLHWAILNGSSPLTSCLLRLGASPTVQNDKKQSAIELARYERDVRLAAVRTAQKEQSEIPAEESEKVFTSLLQQLYDQEVILRLLEEAA